MDNPGSVLIYRVITNNEDKLVVFRKKYLSGECKIYHCTQNSDTINLELISQAFLDKEEYPFSIEKLEELLKSSN